MPGAHRSGARHGQAHHDHEAWQACRGPPATVRGRPEALAQAPWNREVLHGSIQAGCRPVRMGRAEMNSAPLLDTHAWIWWLRRDDRLGAASLEHLDSLDLDHRPCLADISLWEIAMLVERRRLELTTRLADWLERASHPRIVRIIPISPAIA